MTQLAYTFAVFFCSAIVTGLVKRFAIKRNLLDIPNERSSHKKATPRGGGVAIVLSSIVGILVLVKEGTLGFNVAAGLIGGGLAVAIVGFLDDRQGLSPIVRLAVHISAAVWAVYWVGGGPQPGSTDALVEWGWSEKLIAVFAIVWAVNFVNFMDGIDGIAASEAVFFGLAFCGLAFVMPLPIGLALASLVIASACAGFLCWNWPPARIFMGDVGSGYIGFVVAVLGLAAVREHAHALFVWLLLIGAFLVDATVTLIVRLVRGKRLYEAHRSHAYQRLSRRYSSHRAVTLGLIAVNLFWLLPLSVLASAKPAAAAWAALLGLLTVAAGVYIAGAGRDDPPLIRKCKPQKQANGAT